MYDDALSFLLNIRVYAYGLMVMLGVWFGMLTVFIQSRENEKQGLAAGIGGVIALPLGLVLARLLYCLGDPSFYPIMTLRNALQLTTGGYAMYGALAGAAIAALIGAKAAGTGVARMLDITAPALMAFLIPVRLGEGFTSLGISRPLTTEWLKGSFLAFRDEYDAYLRTYLLEAVIALVIFLILLRALKKGKASGTVFLSGCLYYGVSQTLMESLRYDGHLRFGFIGVQQVLSAALFSGALIALAIPLLQRKNESRLLPLLSLVLLPVILFGLIGMEFLVDRSGMGKLTIYALYLLVLAVPLTLGALMLRRRESIGQTVN